MDKGRLLHEAVAVSSFYIFNKQYKTVDNSYKLLYTVYNGGGMK